MKHLILSFSFIAFWGASFAQSIDKVINKNEVERIEKILSDDAMEGRAAGTKGGQKAADFIAGEFKSAGLKPEKGKADYFQRFSMFTTQVSTSELTVNNKKLDADKIIAISPEKQLLITEKSGYKTARIKAGDDARSLIFKYLSEQGNYIVWVDTSFYKLFPRLSRLKSMPVFEDRSNLIFVLTADEPQTFSFNITQDVKEQKMKNVVAVLPGKTKPNEYVIFSGHYDHLGITNQPQGADSIYNGANDDAAGTTAVIMLSKYFKALNNNDRTLVFAAFDAEEIGGFGSQYFSKQFNPSQVMGMFNIEMIGTESKWGKNSAYITGYEKTDMGKILEKNLQGTSFKFYPDPYTDQELFYRSDNATLARLGVPAHTISTSKMDTEPNYHKLSDEIGTLDMDNMVEIIKAIALSSKTIVQGKDTPSRVNTAELQ